MMKRLGEFRLMPIVLIAIGSLFALKTIGLFLDGGYSLGERMAGNSLVVTTVPVAATAQMQSPAVPLGVAPARSAAKQPSWMQEMFNYPSDVTGSIQTTKPAEKAAADKATAAEAANKPVPVEPPPDKGGTPIPMDRQRPASAAERALLERLQERRQELDARARELDLRETMLKAAEKKLESQQAAETAEGGSAGTLAKRKADAEAARFKGLVTMYETMKPKDAAKIFDRLDPKVLLEVAGLIKPQQMAAILAQMSPENAERLTVELASRDGADRTMNLSNLPKIDGRPSGN